MDLLAVQGTLKSLLQHHSAKSSILQQSAFFIVQLSHPYMTTRKTIVLTRWTFVNKVMSLLFNMLSRLVIAFFFPKEKRHLISWLQSPSFLFLSDFLTSLSMLPGITSPKIFSHSNPSCFGDYPLQNSHFNPWRLNLGNPI